ncbi:MAG: Cold shock domain family protein [Candidatus Saccharibacteria bacterium GW2011_GWC2_48_9]|nr:MAG: Cold shock domain family protein [Candidatus Saccharibacteria bacterium GW2011_GWC2_48_9]
METGIVTVSNNLNGYGFIRREKGKDAFFSYDQIISDKIIIEILPGQKISFDIEKTKKGPRAVNIRLI